jgi:hypothetical protein
MGDLELRCAHLSDRDTPRRRARRQALQEHIADIGAEHEQRNTALRRIDHSHIPPLRIAERYAAGKPRDLRYLRPDGE